MRQRMLMTTDFNSIKVQLELPIFWIVLLSVGFQFHKGTIRTPLRQACGSAYAYFNSIKVQLEPLEQEYRLITARNFNSIKVQLERHTFQFLLSDEVHFNSIKVQLEPRPENPASEYLFNFNSIKVQLELIYRGNI